MVMSLIMVFSYIYIMYFDFFNDPVSFISVVYKSVGEFLYWSLVLYQ